MKSTPSLLFFFAVISVLFLNCSQDENLEIDVLDISGEISPEYGICTEFFMDDHGRAFGPSHLFWDKEVLRVRFLGGSEYVRNRVMHYAHQWSDHANIKFEFVSSEPSDIRISFDLDDGSWSYVGRTNEYISSNRATMNFGWFHSRTSESEFRRTTLHEFGHALGLSHEHQHPEVTINWNKRAVYDYYSRTQGWSTSEVNNNIFSKYSTGYTNYSDYDPGSIMHYYIPRSLVTGNWNSSYNTDLSSQDKIFIGQMYPGNEVGGLSCSCPDDLNIIACEDFENHSAVSFDNSDQWSPWTENGNQGELQSYSWGKVLKIEHDQLDNPDVLFSPGSHSGESISLQWNMYVGTGASAYFNIQKTEIPGQEFGAQVYFNTDESGLVLINGRRLEFVFEQGQWLKIDIIRDTGSDLYVLEIDDKVVTSWPLNWSHGSSSGSEDFAAINFYAVDENSRFWLDDFCVSTFEKSIAADDAMVGKSVDVTMQTSMSAQTNGSVPVKSSLPRAEIQ